jgi:hypothetical protein
VDHPPHLGDRKFRSTARAVRTPRVECLLITGGDLLDQITGAAFGRDYVLHEVIGVGATGRVHRAVRRRDDREVAVKLVHPHVADDPEARARLLREDALVRRLSHPSLVPLLDVVLDGGRLGLVFEFVRGTDLRSHLRSSGGCLPLDEVCLVGRQVASALAEAHLRGVLHLDVKPENVLVEAGTDPLRVKVTDFGVGAVRGNAMPRRKQRHGSAGYQAPEVRTGARPTEAADVYAVGRLLAEIAGPRPGSGSETTARRQLDGVIGACTRRWSKARPSAADVADRLLTLHALAVAGREGADPRRVLTEPHERHRQRKPGVSWRASTALGTVGALTAVGLTGALLRPEPGGEGAVGREVAAAAMDPRDREVTTAPTPSMSMPSVSDRPTRVTGASSTALGPNPAAAIPATGTPERGRSSRLTTPATPLGLRATAGDRKITLDWRASAPAGVFYLVSMRDVSLRERWRRLPLPTTATRFESLYLTNGHVYEFQVVANNSAGDSAPTQVVRARPVAPRAAEPPTHLTGASGESSVTLTWRASATSGVFYVVYQRNDTTDEKWHKLPLPTTRTSLHAQYLNSGHTYQFKVTATSEAGESTFSNTVAVVPN